ncbi:MAG: iron ABC transporter permease [Lachnospiraceae bacterium]|nr:iron ABC transporter permease [Lachnospiraceae bacterium]
MRLLFGPEHRRLMPYSMLAGAIFLIFCDTLARTLTAPTEIPVGVVTSVFGAPYFIYLLYRQKSGRG